MSRTVRLSILGLYKYDSTIFDNLVVPDDVDSDELIQNIIMECSELISLYPDSDFMKLAIGNWSNVRLHTWERMAEVLYEDYDAFINIKRDEVRTITQNRDLANTGTGSTSVNAWETSTAQEQTSTNTSGTDTGTITTTETFHVEGDSAITDAQDVLEKELKVRLKYDMYEIITNEFKEKFCLQIY